MLLHAFRSAVLPAGKTYARMMQQVLMSICDTCIWKDGLMKFLSTVIFDNSIQAWLMTLALAVLLYGVFWLARKLLVRRACKMAEKTETDVDDFLLVYILKLF